MEGRMAGPYGARAPLESRATGGRPPLLDTRQAVGYGFSRTTGRTRPLGAGDSPLAPRAVVLPTPDEANEDEASGDVFGWPPHGPGTYRL